MPASGGSLSSDAGLPRRSAAGPDRAEVGRWVISPEGRQGVAARVGEVWRYRRILWFFAVRSVESLYRRTHLGVPWLFIRTIVPLVVASFVFGEVMNVPSHGVPYFVFFVAGQLAWSCFDGPLVRASRGLESNRELLTKLYVPRIILPVGAMAAGLVEPAILSGVLVAALLYYRIGDGQWYVNLDQSPLVGLLVAPAAMLLVIAFSVGLSLFTSIWQARARDMRFVLRYVVGFWMFLTPVVYPLSQVPPQYRWLMQLNPLTAPIETFKWAVLPGWQHSWPWLGYSAGVTLGLLCLGWWYFSRSEQATLDVL
jgi:lipopolysaccharide transport system permease protein